MHLDEHDIARYVDGRLTDEERQEVEAHLAECPRCSDQVAATYRVLNDEGDAPTVPPEVRRQAEALSEEAREERSAGGRLSRRSLVSAGAVVLLLAVAGMLLWQFQSPTSSRLRSTEDRAALSVRAPADGATIAERPVFVCAPVSDAIAYRVTLRRPDGTVVWEGDTSTVRVSLPPDVSLTEGQKYLWRAEAVRPDGTTFPSNLRTFTYSP